MRWLYLLAVALVCVTSQASQTPTSSASAPEANASSGVSGDRTRRSLSDMAARRRSSLDKNFMRFGRSSNFMRFGRSDRDDAIEALRALRCMQLLNALRKIHESDRLQKRAINTVSKADKYADRRNDNFMRLGRGVREADEEENTPSDVKPNPGTATSNEDKYRAERNAMYMDDRFLRMGRDFDDSSAEDVIEIDLPDDKY